jgi:hypothetical protein
MYDVRAVETGEEVLGVKGKPFPRIDGAKPSLWNFQTGRGRRYGCGGEAAGEVGSYGIGPQCHGKAPVLCALPFPPDVVYWLRLRTLFLPKLV